MDTSDQIVSIDGAQDQHTVTTEFDDKNHVKFEIAGIEIPYEVRVQNGLFKAAPMRLTLKSSLVSKNSEHENELKSTEKSNCFVNSNPNLKQISRIRNELKLQFQIAKQFHIKSSRQKRSNLNSLLSTILTHQS